MRKRKRLVALLLLSAMLLNSGMVSTAEEINEETQESEPEIVVESAVNNSEESSEINSKENQEDVQEEAEVNSEENLEDITDEIPEENLEENSEEASEDDLDELKVEEAEEETVDITGFGELAPINTKFKLAYCSLQKKFPNKIEAYCGDKEISIRVKKWEPVTDYNKWLGTYTFSPVLDTDKELAEGVELPLLTVNVEDERERPSNCQLEKLNDNPRQREKKFFGSLIESVGGFFGDGIHSLMGDNSAEDDSLPVSFNGAEQEYMPEVRDQDPEGTCWAFAGMAVMETDAHKHNPQVENSLDLSELHLAYFATHGFKDPKNCHNRDKYVQVPDKDYLMEGGFDFMVYQTVLNGVGPVPESLVSYNKIYEPVDERLATGTNSLRIDNVYQIYTTQPDQIKEAILEHGAVSTYMYADGNCYDAMNNSFYCSDSTVVRDHAITFVGWDDEFPAENFVTEAPGDGAWLVRNSWGLDDYGYNGYFWISYYDAGVVEDDYVVTYSTSLDTYDNTYTYASNPWRDYIYFERNEATVTTEYNVDAGETIEAVAVDNDNNRSKMSVEVTAGDQVAHGYYENDCPGVFTLKLDNPIKVDKATKVSVAVTLEALDTEGVYVTVELNGEVETQSYSYKCPIDKGCNIDGKHYGKDAGIRLYTNNEEKVKTDEKGLRVSETYLKGHAGDTIQIQMAEDSVITDPSKIRWISQDDSIASVDKDGLIKVGPRKGTAVILGNYKDYWVGMYVTVEPFKITYELDEDVLYTKLIDEYYPGDFKACRVTNGMNVCKAGYWFNSWYCEETDTYIRSEYDLADQTGDIVLKAVWEPDPAVIFYYEPTEDLEGYTDEPWFICEEVPLDEIPYKLPDISTMENSPETFAVRSGKNMEFAYWSFDPEGKEPVEVLEKDQLYRIKYNKYSNTYDVTSSTYLYPQYKEKATSGSGNRGGNTGEAGDNPAPTPSVVPVNPEEPENPGTPDVPEEPVNPETPVEPENPENPGDAPENGGNTGEVPSEDVIEHNTNDIPGDNENKDKQDCKNIQNLVCAVVTVIVNAINKIFEFLSGFFRR